MYSMEWTRIFTFVTHTQDFAYFNVLHIYWATHWANIINEIFLGIISFMKDISLLFSRGNAG